MGVFDSNLDFNKYKVFYAVATYKSFSKAASALFISQPAISYQIRELESQLNTKLFVRNNKNVMLTDDGEKLMYYVKEAFDKILLAEDILKEKQEDLTGVIRIGIYSHISGIMLPKIIKDFNKKYPNAQFDIYSTSNAEMIEKLRNKELDLVVLQYPIFINEKKLTEEVLCEMDTCFYTDKKHFELYNKDKSLIKDFKLILPMRGYADINKLEETLKENNYILKHNITSYCSELSVKLVKEGIGVSWGLKKLIEKELKEKELFEIKLPFDMPKAKFSIAYDKNFLSKTTNEFIKYLKRHINDVCK